MFFVPPSFRSSLFFDRYNRQRKLAWRRPAPNLQEHACLLGSPSKGDDCDDHRKVCFLITPTGERQEPLQSVQKRWMERGVRSAKDGTKKSENVSREITGGTMRQCSENRTTKGHLHGEQKGGSGGGGTEMGSQRRAICPGQFEHLNRGGWRTCCLVIEKAAAVPLRPAVPRAADSDTPWPPEGKVCPAVL